MIDPGIEVHCVEHAESWRMERTRISFLLPLSDTDGHGMVSLLREANKLGLPNPRVITPSVAAWSNLLHPRFYEALRRSGSRHATRHQAFSVRGLGRPTSTELAKIHLESVLFLAGVTLSAAVIQGRWSAGTVGSKLDRLWQAGCQSAEGSCAPLDSLNLCAAVRQLAKNNGLAGIDRLIQIRRHFMEVSYVLALGKVCSRKRIAPAQPVPLKFAFVEQLVAKLRGVQCVIVYGSSVSGDSYNDYDVIVILSDPETAMRALANTRPLWNGIEINLSIYSPSEFWCMQLMSGDNLADYGLCVFGEIECPEKPIGALLMRNMSFAMVRHRQQLGMACAASAAGAPSLDANLQDYFVKIPANVVKGTLGAVGRRIPKEEAHRWLREAVGFDTAVEQRRAAGEPALALCNSACATARSLDALNQELTIVEYRQ